MATDPEVKMLMDDLTAFMEDYKAWENIGSIGRNSLWDQQFYFKQLAMQADSLHCQNKIIDFIKTGKSQSEFCSEY